MVQTGHFLELVDGEINTWHLTCLMVSLGVRDFDQYISPIIIQLIQLLFMHS